MHISVHIKTSWVFFFLNYRQDLKLFKSTISFSNHAVYLLAVYLFQIYCYFPSLTQFSSTKMLSVEI